MHSPKTKAPSLPKEHFEIFKFLMVNDSKKGFKFMKFGLFKLFPLTFNVQIFLYKVKDFNKYSKPMNSKSQFDIFNSRKLVKICNDFDNTFMPESFN